VGDQLSFSVEDQRITANYKGFYNVYNILAAYAAVRSAGFTGEHFEDMLRKFNPENGRMEQFRIQGSSVILNLAKNPAGFNQNIAAVMQDPNPKDIIIAINDNAQDGIDISWLWDVDFDCLGAENIRSITVSGIRCQDMRLRLKYVDIPSMLEADVEQAIRKRIEDGTGNLYVLVNYTALFSTRTILSKMQEEKR
jgi:UDP-N-acetylmuramyl tripeptide synthase